MSLSTFNTLNTAARGLAAARQQIAIAGQNTANAGTVGYTRQSVQLQGLAGTQGAGLFPGPAGPGQGVGVAGLDRAASAFLDRQVRTAVAQSGFQGVRAEMYSGIEDVLKEPGDQGISSALNGFYAAWQDVANSPDSEASTAVLLERATSLAARIATDHGTLSGQWHNQVAALRTNVDQANVFASQLAELNSTIRQTVANGGSANELLDSRDQIGEQLAGLTGGQLRVNPDGTADFLVGGNALVEGDTAKSLQVTPAGNAQPGDVLTVAWSHRGAGSGIDASAGVDGGLIAGRLSATSPAGPLVSSLDAYDTLATSLATGTNAAHSTGVTADGAAGGDFFTYDPANPALGLSVQITSPADVAFAAPGGGALDGSVADAISQLGAGVSKPWAGFVTGTGAASRAALDGLAVSSTSEATARSSQLSLGSVDLDEEAVNLVTFQHAFQASARVLTAVDEMLDILINRTGMVGR
ncbi:flagellar hook-associated protein FlgK (plasmid) [Citricoccus nitrophenolicus]